MELKKEIPKYVQDLLQRRYKLALKLADVCNEVDVYCGKIGIDISNHDYADLMIHGHVGIYTEPYVALKEVREAIENKLSKEKDDVQSN